MPSIITRGAFSKDMLININKWVGVSADAVPVAYDKVFAVSDSSRAFEEDVMVSGLGLPQVVAEGAATPYDSMGQRWLKRYEHVKYANGFVITKEMLDDGQSDLIAKLRSKELGKRMAEAREVIAMNIFNNGFDTNYSNGGDGKALFRTDHPTDASDGSNTLAVAADLSEASLEQAVNDIGSYRNQRGMVEPARALSLLIPAQSLQFEAARILKNMDRPATADRDINALVKLGMFPEGIVTSYYLTDPDAFFIKTSAAPDQGLRFLNRRGIEIMEDNDFGTENLLVKAVMRFAAGWTDWRNAYGSPGA